MVRLLERFGRILLGLGLLLLLLAAGLGYYSNTESFRQMVREQIIAAINGTIRGRVELERVEGSIWGNVILHEARLYHQDVEIIRIPRLTLSYDLLPLLRGQLNISRAEAQRPVGFLVRNRRSEWNIAEALASVSESESKSTVLLKYLGIRDGDLNIRLEGDAPRHYQLKNISLASRLAIEPKGLEFAARAVNARLNADKLPELNLKGAFAYRDSSSSQTIAVNDLRIETAASRVNLSGELVGLNHGQLNARLELQRLAPNDIGRVVAGWPVQKIVTGEIRASGPLHALVLTSELAAAGANLKSELTVDALAQTPRYRGTIRFTAVDPGKLLDSKQFAGVLDGETKFEGAAFDVTQVSANGNFRMRSAQVKDWALGNLRLNAELRDGVVAVDGDLSGAMGSADWRGKVSLVKVPNYDFALTVNKLDIKKMAGGAEIPHGVVSFKATAQGSGFSLAESKAQLNLEVLPSSIGPVQLRGGELSAVFGGGRIGIARASLSSADTMLSIKGDVGIKLDQRGRLDYELRSANLTPWLALIGHNGAGSMTLTGSAQGSLAELAARGVLKTAQLRIDGFSAGNGVLHFNLARKDGQAIPDGSVNAQLTDLQAGAELQKLDASIKLLASKGAAIEARAQDKAGQGHALRADIDYRAPDIAARVSQLSLSLPDGNWTLAQPAALTMRGDSFAIENFKLRNQERQATVDGQISRRGAQSLSLTLVRFPLESIGAFLPSQPKMTGLVALQGQIGGTAASPQINGNLQLTDATIGGQKYDGMMAVVDYRERQASLDLTVHQDRSHTLSANGKLPLRLSWQDGWHAEAAGDLELRLKSDGLSAAILNGYMGKSVSDIAGELSLDVTARGALSQPRLSGSLRFTGGKLRLTALNVDIHEINSEASFDARRLTIEKFSARAKDGQLTGSGLLSLDQYNLDDFQLSLAAQRWPAIQTRRYQAEAGGTLTLSGSLSAPKLRGQIDIAEASLRPDLAFLARSSTPAVRDKSIVIVNNNSSGGTGLVERSANGGLGDVELFKKLALDIDIRLARNVWIRHPEATVELKGAVRAQKNSGQEPQLVGSTQVVRGWTVFQGRRFEFVRGEIRFIGGGKIDPQLDILLQHRLPQYTVDAVVGGTAEKPSLVLRSDPALDQSDILALLVFGKPTKDLNRGEQNSLAQSALDVTGGFAAAQFGAAVAKSLGLENLGIDPGDLDFSGGRIGYGRYIGQRTYVTLSQELAGERGQKATLEYQIFNDWKIESSTTSKGSSEVGIIWRKRY